MALYLADMLSTGTIFSCYVCLDHGPMEVHGTSSFHSQRGQFDALCSFESIVKYKHIHRTAINHESRG